MRDEKSDFRGLAEQLVNYAREFHSRGWTLGTSGNFSAVVSSQPLTLAITPSGADKGALNAGDLLRVDAQGTPIETTVRPSAETSLHLAVVRLRSAGAVLHTHSVWSTIISEAQASAGGLRIEGFEMLKGLQGVDTHEHIEWIPIIENSQNYSALVASLEEALTSHPQAHGVLLRRHGLYTWGKDLGQAKRHLEILEFLLEVLGRTYCSRARED